MGGLSKNGESSRGKAIVSSLTCHAFSPLAPWGATAWHILRPLAPSIPLSHLSPLCDKFWFISPIISAKPGDEMAYFLLGLTYRSSLMSYVPRQKLYLACR